MSVVRRHPMLYLLTLIAALILHSFLCYPAATSRGYPPMDPFWEHIAIYLAFLGVGVAPAFDDFRDFPALRRSFLIGFSCSACLVLAAAKTNLGSARPHIGSTAGYWALYQYDWQMIAISTLFFSVVAIPFVVCFESVASSFWGILNRTQRNTVA
jgi:hypothetical protein